MGFGIGSIISAGASLLGGVLGNKSQESANDQNAALQREFAQNGISWKIEDGAKHGLHPLASIGAQGYQAAPSYIGDSSLGNSVANLGQNIRRSIDSTRTGSRRKAAAVADKLQLENMKLQNDLLRSQITKVHAATNPAFPSQAGSMIPGQGDSGDVEVLPSQRTSTAKGSPSTEAAISPANKMFLNKDGTISVWPSSDAKQSIEDSPYELEHIWSNRFIPWLDKNFGQNVDRYLDSRQNWENARQKTRRYW